LLYFIIKGIDVVEIQNKIFVSIITIYNYTIFTTYEEGLELRSRLKVATRGDCSTAARKFS
jgi:hypothetical protein